MLTDERINRCGKHTFIDFSNKVMCLKCGVPKPKFRCGDKIRRISNHHHSLHIGCDAQVISTPPVWERGMWRYKLVAWTDRATVLPGVWGENYFELVIKWGSPITVKSLLEFDNEIIIKRELHRMQAQLEDSFRIPVSMLFDYENKTIKENKMNEWVIKSYPQTADAVLVQKHFGHQLNANKLLQIALTGKEKDLLAAAKELEPQPTTKE